MRVFTSVQPAPHAGQSSLSEYIAKSKVDREREHLGERGARPLFTMYEDDLTYVEADAILNPTSGELLAEDLIHAVISPERGSFERAGLTHEERLEAFRDAIRDAVRVIQVELRVKRLFWVGGFHGNTLTPRGHLAFSRWAIDYEGNLVYIKHLPESLLPRNREGQDGAKRFSAGKIAEVFAQSLERHFKPVRFVEIADAARGVEVSRSIVTAARAELREPTPDERTVGRWLEAELALAREVAMTGVARDELVRECETLKTAVAGIDVEARVRGAHPPSAYVEPARLEELLKGNVSASLAKVYTVRPIGAVEKYVEVIPAQATTIVPKDLSELSQEKEGRDQISDTSSPAQSQERFAPERTALIKPVSAEKGQEIRLNDRADQQTTRRGGILKNKDIVAKEAKKEAPQRIGKMTIWELRDHPPLAAMAISSPERVSASEQSKDKGGELFPETVLGGQPQITVGDRPQGAQVERENDHKTGIAEITPTIMPIGTELSYSATEHSVESGAAAKETSHSPKLTDEELGRISRNLTFSQRYLERVIELQEAAATKEVEERRTRGENLSAEELNKIRNSFERLNIMLREANLLIDIYVEAGQKRNVKQERLTQGQEDALKGRETRMSQVAVDYLLSELNLAREKLPAIATTSNHKAIEAYRNFREQNYSKIKLVSDGQESQSREASIKAKEGQTLGASEHTSHEEKEHGAINNVAQQIEQATVRKGIIERTR